MDNTKILKYDKLIMSAFPDYVAAVSNGKTGLVSLDNKILCDFIYDDLSEFKTDQILYNDNYCIMRLNGKWGIIDILGNTIIDFKFDEPIRVKQHNNHKIIKLDKWGIVDNDWHIVIECKYDKISYFDFNYIYEIKNKKGLMDLQGRTLTEPVFDSLIQYDGISGKRFYIARTGDRTGIIDSSGKKIIDFIYKKINIFTSADEYFVVQKENCKKYGVINVKNEIIMECEYDEIEVLKDYQRQDIFFHCKKAETEFLFSRKEFKIS